MNRIEKIYWTVKAVGWDNVPRRILQEIRRRNGYLKKNLHPDRFGQAEFERLGSLSDVAVRRALQNVLPSFDRHGTWAAPWGRKPLDHSLAEKTSETRASENEGQNEDEFEKDRSPNVERFLWDRCEKALAGDALFFGHWYGHLNWPPDFNWDPKHDLRYPIGPPPSQTAKSGPPRDDIKLVWEASRLSLAFYFARAYAASSEEKWAQAFWELFDAWEAQNPPMQSVAWGCGQESALRLMAVLFAAQMTRNSASASTDRLRRLACFVWRTGRLIAVNINYALSQKNNHGLSESVGLLTAGLFLNAAFQTHRFEPWIRNGQSFLEKEIKRQIASDGSFVQNSLNYHRVMMDDLLWALSLPNLTWSAALRQKFQRATDWLAEMIDRSSGRVPNYGANDGAQVLPLSSCDYLDYRPVLQAAWFFCHRARFFESGPWDEKACWLFGGDFVQAPLRPMTLSPLFEAKEKGYFVLRGPRSWALTRCHTFRGRPGHPDMLLFDLWYDGRNIVRDDGSYHYYTAESVKDYFRSTAAQNTIEVDSKDQMVRGPSFLWYYWTQARLLTFQAIPDKLSAGKNATDNRSTDEKPIGEKSFGEKSAFEGVRTVFEGEHFGYRRLAGRVTHRRKIEQIDDRWTVTDQIEAAKAGRHRIVSRFRLEPGNWTLIEEAGRVVCQKEDFRITFPKTPPFFVRLIEGNSSEAVQAPAILNGTQPRTNLTETPLCNAASDRNSNGVNPSETAKTKSASCEEQKEKNPPADSKDDPWKIEQSWESLYYGEKRAVPTLTISGEYDFEPNRPLCLVYSFEKREETQTRP